MKQVKDENNGRKCLYFVDEDANAELTRRLLNGISHSLKDDPTIVDWVVGEMKKNHCEDFVGDWDDEPTTGMMSKDSEDGRYTMYWNSYGEIEIWGNENISDSRRIKDENTPNVLDGVLFIAFTDGTEDDMIAEVNKHANESDTIDGVQYETYETDSDDGVAMIDMCAATDNANGFVKALLKKWGIAKNVADLQFEASDEMKEAVNDSRKVGDDAPRRFRPVTPKTSMYERGVGYEHPSDIARRNYEMRQYLKEQGVPEWEIDDILKETVKDSRVNDMTKPAHLRGYAEKVRAKRRNKNVDDEPNTDEEKPNVSDSRIRDGFATRYDVAYNEDPYKLAQRIAKNGTISTRSRHQRPHDVNVNKDTIFHVHNDGDYSYNDFMNKYGVSDSISIDEPIDYNEVESVADELHYLDVLRSSNLIEGDFMGQGEIFDIIESIDEARLGLQYCLDDFLKEFKKYENGDSDDWRDYAYQARDYFEIFEEYCNKYVKNSGRGVEYFNAITDTRVLLDKIDTWL